MRTIALLFASFSSLVLGCRAYISAKRSKPQKAPHSLAEVMRWVSCRQAGASSLPHKSAVLCQALTPIAGWKVGSHETLRASAVRGQRSDRGHFLALASLLAGHHALLSNGRLAWADEVKMEGLLGGQGKSKTYFSDFETAPSGLQFKDYKLGTGPMPNEGDTVLVDWSGVTIGYQGRYFQARNKPKGGAFAGDGFQDVLTFKVGDGTVIPGVDEAVRSMSKGSIRRILVPEEIGYPSDGFARVGPKPNTFSGERALDFVLSSKGGLMDKTLMFDLKLVDVKPKK